MGPYPLSFFGLIMPNHEIPSLRSPETALRMLEASYAAIRHQHDTEAAKRYISAHWNRYLWLTQRIPDISPGARSLEIGASILSSLLKREFRSEVTVAYHELESEWAERFREEGITGHALEILRDRLPFEENGFELILCDQILEHLPVAPHFLLKRLFQLLTPGGELLLCVPNFANFEKRIALLRGSNPQDNMDSDYVYYAHHREPVMAECREWVKTCGGVVVEDCITDFEASTSFPLKIWNTARYLKHAEFHRIAHLLLPSMRDYIFLRCAKRPGFHLDKTETTPPLKRTGEFGSPPL